jgi:hypothetical protein
MPYTADKQNPKPFKVMPGCQTINDFNVTIIAGCSGEVEHPE